MAFFCPENVREPKEKIEGVSGSYLFRRYLDN
jgi:hypothetical protein